MVTIQEISRITNYATSTVSKALNGYPDISEKTRKKILKIAEELGYVPNATAQSLVKKKSNTIGIVFEVEYGLNNLFFATILESIRKQLVFKGYDILFLSNNSESGFDYLKHCYSKQVDGVLIISKGSTDSEAIYKLQDSNIPVLTFDPDVEMQNSIYTDSYYSIKEACNYLYALGHKKITFIQGDKYNFIGKQRHDAYLDFMNEIGSEPLIINELNNTHYTYEEGYNTMKRNYELFGLPDAVIAASDLMALGAIAFLKEKGINIPNDVSVIGFDDIQLCEIVQPKLSTIRQNYELIGQKACETLIYMIENKVKDIAPVVIKPDLIIRESCGKKIS